MRINFACLSLSSSPLLSPRGEPTGDLETVLSGLQPFSDDLVTNASGFESLSSNGLFGALEAVALFSSEADTDNGGISGGGGGGG
eukprot:CAMPEP_0169261990 /NCGR_PEP_ID=MMETSP1016-20121227/43421_1 /TAXON_ID=342587 /ORGANISM="Karlodinium micrum, Strain CCMP2283" /LENGTH=84 /DNA_ID=CAMNT_0009344391 /DNA_START=956 /DNA_END=1210 /DNA_ORIENTATION=+